MMKLVNMMVMARSVEGGIMALYTFSISRPDGRTYIGTHISITYFDQPSWGSVLRWGHRDIDAYSQP